jgi:hypothetical protein
VDFPCRFDGRQAKEAAGHSRKCPNGQHPPSRCKTPTSPPPRTLTRPTAISTASLNRSRRFLRLAWIRSSHALRPDSILSRPPPQARNAAHHSPLQRGALRVQGP